MSVERMTAPDAETISRLAFASIWAGGPLPLDELIQQAGWNRSRAFAAIGQLLQAGRLELSDREIVGAHGVTLHPTAHRISHDGGEAHTWCAFDAVGIPAALGIDAEVASTCPTCDRELLLQVHAGEPDAQPMVVWMPLGPCEHLMSDFCARANLFCSRQHLEDWRLVVGTPAGDAMTLDESARLGRRAWADVGA